MKLYSRTDEFLTSRSIISAKIPDLLSQLNILFKANRKRRYIGIEAIEDKKDARRVRRRAERDIKAQRRENKVRSQELFKGRTAYEE
jgi:hypothetical protein